MGNGKLFLKLALLLAVLLGIAGGGYYKLEEFSARKVREVADRYSHLASFDFERALINPLNRSLYIWNISCDFAVGSSFSADKLVVEKFDREHSVPRFFKGAVQGISVPVDFMNLGSLADDFRKMGYDKLNFDLSADYIYEDETKRLSVRYLCFEGSDLCRFSAGFDLGDVKLRSPGISGFIGVSMLDGGLVLQDKSLTGRLMDLSAGQAKIDSALYREKLLEGLQLRMQTAKSLGNGHAENFYAEIKKFIGSPAKLVIKVDPAEPVPLIYMFMGRNFEELLNLYGVTVEARSL